MKKLWCWRCQQEIPMLDEEEFARVIGQPRLIFDQVRQKHPDVRSRQMMQNVFKGSLDEYERLTGMREMNMNAVWHHRISIYGPPCVACGKPLRTPRATFCAACGHRRSTAQLPN